MDWLDEKLRDEWTPIIWLTEVYTQAMVTMGDDEFFSSSSSYPTPAGMLAPRNLLSLDDLKVFSRKLLNIAFTLYSKDPVESDAVARVGVGVEWLGRWTWEGVREAVGRCLRGVHARE